MLGPARVVSCKRCQGRISVPWGRALVAFLLGQLALLMAAFLGLLISINLGLTLLESFWCAGIGIVVGFWAFMWLYAHLVPLVPRA